MSDNLLTCWPALFMNVRCETARKCVPREAYLDSEARDWLCCLLQCLSRFSDGDRHQEEGCQSPTVCPRLQQKFHE